MKDGRDGYEIIDCIVRVLSSCSIPQEAIFNAILNWLKLKENCSDDYRILAEKEALRSWLKVHYDVIFGSNAARNASETSYSILMKYIEQGSADKIHKFLKTYGIPDSTNFKELITPLIDHYIENQDCLSLIEILPVLSSFEAKSNNRAVQSYHLLGVLGKYMLYNNGTAVTTSAVDFAYELRHLFPFALFQKENASYTSKSTRKFFKKYLKVYPIRTDEQTAQILDLIRAILKLKFIDSYQGDILSEKVVNNVLQNRSWNDAVLTWLKFQSVCESPTGFGVLLKHSYLFGTQERSNYLIHKAKTVISESLIDAINAGILVQLQMDVRAQEIFKNVIMSPWDLLRAFCLINHLVQNKDEGLFSINFARMCLQYSDVAKNEVVFQSFHKNWLNFCETKKFGDLALRFYLLFKEKGHFLRVDQLQRVWSLVNKQQNEAENSIHHQNGVEKSKILDSLLEKYEEIQSDLKAKLCSECSNV